jgi:protein-disulfide isomerase
MELLFETQPMWGDHHNPRPELIFEYLPRLNLDMERLKLDMQSDKITALIEADVRDLKALNVRKTPTFFVNGVRLERFGLSYLDALVQQEIEKVY